MYAVHFWSVWTLYKQTFQCMGVWSRAYGPQKKLFVYGECVCVYVSDTEHILVHAPCIIQLIVASVLFAYSVAVRLHLFLKLTQHILDMCCDPSCSHNNTQHCVPEQPLLPFICGSSSRFCLISCFSMMLFDRLQMLPPAAGSKKYITTIMNIEKMQCGVFNKCLYTVY